MPGYMCHTFTGISFELFLKPLYQILQYVKNITPLWFPIADKTNAIFICKYSWSDDWRSFSSVINYLDLRRNQL